MKATKIDAEIYPCLIGFRVRLNGQEAGEDFKTRIEAKRFIKRQQEAADWEAAHKFLEATDPDAFLDYPLAPQPVERHPDWTVPCPACQGHGGWNLKVNAYPLHGLADTPENRHNHSHFICHCSQCAGWGWTTPSDAECIHDFARELSFDECKRRGITHFGRCWHVYECSKCGHTIAQDSSD